MENHLFPPPPAINEKIAEYQRDELPGLKMSLDLFFFYLF